MIELLYRKNNFFFKCGNWTVEKKDIIIVLCALFAELLSKIEFNPLVGSIYALFTYKMIFIAVLTVEIGVDVSGNDRMFLAKFQILLILYV